MSTIIRPELSEKNQYYISKHRYYELKHFCLQYPEWKKQKVYLESLCLSGSGLIKPQNDDFRSSKVEIIAEELLKIDTQLNLLHNIAEKTDECLSNYILLGVTEGYTYEYLRTIKDIPCCRDIYYTCYRRFFWILDKER